jgi:hypothetical protein
LGTLCARQAKSLVKTAAFDAVEDEPGGRFPEAWRTISEQTIGVLKITSLLSLLLLTLHVTDDIVRGISKAESSNTALLVLVVFLYGTLGARRTAMGATSSCSSWDCSR